MSPEEKAFSDAVDIFEILLDSETQAIVSIELDKLEQIIQEKDKALSSVLELREKLSIDPREIPELGMRLDRVLKIQSRNSRTLNEIIARKAQSGEELTVEKTLQIKKIRSAYTAKHQSESNRFKV